MVKEIHLFSSLRIKDIEFKNRIFVSPMCQYSSENGMPTDWHLVHLGSRAVGGAALVMVEATAVSPEGRISPSDSGIWSDKHAQAFSPITAFIKSQGSIPAIQIAHAGRKASTDSPWHGGKPLTLNEGGWEVIGPSPISFDKNYPIPKELTENQLEQEVDKFAQAAKRAFNAGFEVLEIHMAHGYLLHQFLSPLSNKREDAYGGSFENRTRFPLIVAKAVRENWPNSLPLFVRISATDWVENGWDLSQSIRFCSLLKNIGVDLIDCSSGGLLPRVNIAVAPNYQVPFAQAIKEIPIYTGAVGCITEPIQAEQIISNNQADVVFLARELLRNPYWPLQAAKELGVDIEWPKQYLRSKL